MWMWWSWVSRGDYTTLVVKKNDSNDKVVGGGGHNLGVADVSVSRFEVPQLSWWMSGGLPMRETRMTNTTKIRMPTMPHQQQSTLFEQPEKPRAVL